MSEELGKLQKDPLFLGLTRPAMILGVTYLWLSAEGLFWMIFFINTKNMLAMLIGAPITHLVGYVLCMKEMRFLELIMIWGATCAKCRNTKFHGNTSSYDLY